MGGWRVSMSDTTLDKATKVCVVRCWYSVARKWEASFLHVVYKKVPMFLCIPHRIILWMYVDEYENHRRMVLYYIIQRTRQYIRILSRSCPHRRSTHPFLSNISIPLILQIMSPSCCILLDHAHIVDQHITSFVDSTRLVLQDYEHIMLHTPRSYTHWRSTHPFLRRFDSHTIKRL
jgi:hypothetical protein